MGEIKPAIPSTIRILKILLPMMLPKAISSCPVIVEKIFTINSGADVPKATIVNPIAISDMENLFAKEEAPSTKRSAPLTRIIKPKTNNKIGINIV